jgi:phenylacetate-CoA ligase
VTGRIVFADRREIEAVQEANFAETMDLVLVRHPYYRALAAQRGLTRGTFASLSDLQNLPVTTKADYMVAPERFLLEADGLPDEMQVVWDTMYTTGSTAGKPTPFVSTTFDFFQILELQRNMLGLRGVRADDLIANLFPITRAPHGAWIRVLHAAASLNVPVVSAMPGRPSEYFSVGNDTDSVVRLIERSGATVLWGVPSYIARVVARAHELGVQLPRVRLLFVTGEGLGEAAREELGAAFARVGARVSVSISYGSTEMQGGFVECAPGSGYHNPAPDQVYLEIVDPESGRPVPDGTPGLVTITHLKRRGTVLLRYSLGDTSVLSREQCPLCGAWTDRLVAMPCRTDELVKIKGTLVNPAVLIDVLEGALGARPFEAAVEQTDAGPLAADALVIRIARSGAAEPDESALASRVRAAVGVTPEIRLVAAEALGDPGERWKMKKFVDRRAR